MDFCRWAGKGEVVKSCGDQDIPELGDHVGGGWLGLDGVSGGVEAASGAFVGVVAAVAYQMIARVWQISVKGGVRRTAPATRLRACPAPRTCLASSIPTSVSHR